MVLDDVVTSTADAIMSIPFKVLLDTLARSDFYRQAALRFTIAALKTVSKCSFTICKLRLFDYFCLAPTKNSHRAKASIDKNKLT
jgi:hypothetical protein